MREVITAKKAIEIIEDYYGAIDLANVCENKEYYCIVEDDYDEDSDSYYFVNKKTGKIETMFIYETDKLYDVPEEEWKQ